MNGKNIGRPVAKAGKEDYEQVQGGMPTVRQEGNLKVVTHNYPGGEDMEVRSHIDHGTVDLTVEGKTKEYEVDLLKKFRGEPCEAQSRRSGGEGYPRRTQDKER